MENVNAEKSGKIEKITMNISNKVLTCRECVAVETRTKLTSFHIRAEALPELFCITTEIIHSIRINLKHTKGYVHVLVKFKQPNLNCT